MTGWTGIPAKTKEKGTAGILADMLGTGVPGCMVPLLTYLHKTCEAQVLEAFTIVLAKPSLFSSIVPRVNRVRLTAFWRLQLLAPNCCMELERKRLQLNLLTHRSPGRRCQSQPPVLSCLSDCGVAWSAVSAFFR